MNDDNPLIPRSAGLIPTARGAEIPGRDKTPGRIDGRSAWLALLCVLVAMTRLSGCGSLPPAHYNPASPLYPDEFSHVAWHRVVGAHVSGDQVLYPAIAGDKNFPAYLAAMERLDPTILQTGEVRLAFWINAFNAMAVQGILDGYAPSSLWGRYRYFVGDDHVVGGSLVNLYNIERRMAVPTRDEPRLHFALAYPARSSPRLQPWAYEAGQLERQLDEAARIFINDLNKNRFDREARVAYLSPLFNWFAEEFIRKGGSVIQYIKPYLDDPALVKDLEQRPYRIEYLDFDWSLNGPPPHP